MNVCIIRARISLGGSREVLPDQSGPLNYGPYTPWSPPRLSRETDPADPYAGTRVSCERNYQHLSDRNVSLLVGDPHGTLVIVFRSYERVHEYD